MPFTSGEGGPLNTSLECTPEEAKAARKLCTFARAKKKQGSRVVCCLLFVVVLVGWLVGWLGGWVVGWLVDWLVGWLIGWLLSDVLLLYLDGWWVPGWWKSRDGHCRVMMS